MDAVSVLSLKDGIVAYHTSERSAVVTIDAAAIVGGRADAGGLVSAIRHGHTAETGDGHSHMVGCYMGD